MFGSNHAATPQDDPEGPEPAGLDELRELAQAAGRSGERVTKDSPPALREAFLRDMLDHESWPLGTYFERLTDAGVGLPDPAALDDAELHVALWDVIRGLAVLRAYLHRTDHLSDRELYEYLWRDALREVNEMPPPNSGWRYHLDPLGGCSEEDVQLSLRYYDDEETRQHWARDFPEDHIPAHEDPPFDRDRFLPDADDCEGPPDGEDE